MSCAEAPLSGNMAAELMRAGEAVIFPTESFFAVGSRVFSEKATAYIFRVKRRSTLRPLPIIIGELGQLDMVTPGEGPALRLARPLLEAFWPGPLSVLFPARLRVPEILTGGSGRVAVRLSAHPAARELALALGEPISASSANISGSPSVTASADLDPELLAGVSGVLDLPPAPSGGLPSTLVECLENGRLHLLRPGRVSRDDLEDAGFTVV